LQRHAPRISAEFLVQRRGQGVDDPTDVDPTPRPNLVDQRVAVDESSRECGSLRDPLFQLDHSNPDVRKAGVDQRFLDGINPVAGKRYSVI
jgi:hypothetical protein